MVSLQTEAETELTPPCALGFLDRLSFLLNEGCGLHKRGYISFLVDSTGLSKSGARRILDDKRPPKRLAIFQKLVSSISSSIQNHRGLAVSKDEISRYLLEDRPIPLLSKKDDFDISVYLNKDPLLTSQIIIRIDEITKEIQVDKKSLNKKDMLIINFRIISYCFKNSIDPQSDKASHMIRNFLELAQQDLL